MITRILILIAVVGIVMLFFGFDRDDTLLMASGFFAILIGFFGAIRSAQNKKGMGFLGWIWKKL